MDFFAFLAPIEWVVAWIMYLCHQGLVFLGFSDGPGPAWSCRSSAWSSSSASC